MGFYASCPWVRVGFVTVFPKEYNGRDAVPISWYGIQEAIASNSCSWPEIVSSGRSQSPCKKSDYPEIITPWQSPSQPWGERGAQTAWLFQLVQPRYHLPRPQRVISLHLHMRPQVRTSGWAPSTYSCEKSWFSNYFKQLSGWLTVVFNFHSNWDNSNGYSTIQFWQYPSRFAQNTTRLGKIPPQDSLNSRHQVQSFGVSRSHSFLTAWLKIQRFPQSPQVQ